VLGYLCANFSLPRPVLDLCPRYATDVRRTSSLNAFALWVGGIIREKFCRVNHTHCVAKISVTRMLARDLFAVANLVQVFILKQTDVRQHHRLMPPPRGRAIIKRPHLRVWIKKIRIYE